MPILEDKINNFFKKIKSKFVNPTYTFTTLAVPIAGGILAGVLIGYGTGFLTNYDSSLAEQTEQTYQIARNYALIGTGVGAIIGTIKGCYDFIKLD